MTVAIAAVTMAAGTAFAADHNDSPAVTNDPTTDIADVLAWMNGDDVVLVMTVAGAEFSDAGQYVFNVGSGAAFAPVAAPTVNTQVICTFETGTTSCWVGEADYASGDASDGTAPLVSESGAVTVYQGLRNDPFFFNAAGFFATVDAVLAAAGDPNFMTDANGCPTLDQATSDALVALLASDGMDGAGADAFADSEVATLVVQIDKTLLNGGGPFLSVWGSTHSAQ